MSVSYNVSEVFSGVLHKCGARIKSWNKRWFVLKSDYCLYYYKDTAKGHLGLISIRDPKFKVRKGEAGDIAWPKGVKLESTIAVVTTHRTYYMYSPSKDSAEEWLKVLDTTRMKLLEEAHSANRLLSDARSSVTSIEEQEPGRTQLLSDSSSPVLMVEEQNYEAVYDQPEADLSQHSSDNSPNVNSSRDTSKNGWGPTNEVGGETDAVYDLANAAVDGDIDEQQPLYAEAAAPEAEHEEVDEPSAVYDDVEIQHPNKSEQGKEESEGMSVYDDVEITQLKKEVSSSRDTSLEFYEPLDLETASAKNLPLPPVPLGRDGSQPIYEDIPDPSGSAQPLYEAVIPEDTTSSERYIREVDSSDEEMTRSTEPVPPLPPKDDLPPLPPKDDLPPLPPKDDLRPPPSRGKVPELPPKDSPPSRHKGGQSAAAVSIQIPPLPPKEDSLDQRTNKRGVPPLSLREDVSSENDLKPVASPRHKQPASGRHGSSSSSNDSLSPSAQGKPLPKERTLTPPMIRKPSPVPRRKVIAGTDKTHTGQAVNGDRENRCPSGPAKVTVTSPTETEPLRSKEQGE